MKIGGITMAALAMTASCAWSQQTPVSVTREWTSADGRKIVAGYEGVQGENVMLKLQNGKVAPIPLLKLSEPDNAFVKSHPLDYREPWTAWPVDPQITPSTIDVTETAVAGGGYEYTTPHFRFKTNVNLGKALMKDLAVVFELTYRLHSKSPFGILAKPANDLFEAKLFATSDEYKAAGGPLLTAGVYLPKEKVFLAPLDLMGVKSGSAGLRRVSRDDYDTSTIVHELTHMLTHDMLQNLPLWVNEGYAEYVSSIPIEGNSFRVSAEKIEEGVLDRFARDYERGTSGNVKLSTSARRDYLKGDKLPNLVRVEKVLKMTDAEWAGHRSGFSSPGELADLPRLYRTAHLIIYYFIQIEGEKGVAKIRKFLEENRVQQARYDAYVAAYSNYQKQLLAFMNLPGVTKLPDGRIQYPSNLTPPVAPEAPFTDPNLVKMGGLGALLDGETAEVVGARIENTLREKLAINLRFAN
ncbi:MAG: hypothetical protein ABIS50_12895 [Luteolibacter sp.]|uniref:hypothetical protein n=1 Tax=Luteolibacter sp. TaxID=1962973 RepID=UPI0032672414